MKKSLAFLSLLSSLSFAEAAPSLQLGLRHTEPRGVGFYEGYTTLEAFFLGSPCSWIFPYVDFRGHMFNDGRRAYNTGLGVRKTWGDRLYGANAYYDYRKVPHKSFNQFSLGVETIGTLWDFYANGYVVLGSRKSDPYGAVFGNFTGNLLLAKQTLQQAFSGAEAIGRVHFLKQEKWDLSLDFGPYYFTAPYTKNVVGGTASLSAKIADYLYVQANTSYDRVFKWLGQGTVGISIPLGREKTNCPVFEARREQFPNHRDIVVVDKHKTFTPAIDPATGNPYKFLFVNNTSHSNGTFESPFNTLATAESASSPYDVIYVMQGDGTSNNMNAGITLQDNQQLLGSGAPQTIPTTLGPITIPALTSGYPVITNTAAMGTAVTLANNNTVSGIHIDSPMGEGIYGLGTSNVTIANNILSHVNTGNNANYFAIDLEGPGLSGTHSIFGNTILQTSSDNAASAIYIQPGLSGGALIPDVCSILIANNQIQTEGYGIQLTDSETILTLNILNNTISTNLKQGINIQPKAASVVTTLIQNNVITQSAGVALGIQPRDQSNIYATVINNEFTGSQKGVQIVSGGTGGTVVTTLTGNSFSNNTTNDLIANLSGTDTNSFCIRLQNNSAPQIGYLIENTQGGAFGSINLGQFINNVGPLTVIGNVTVNTCP